MHDKTMSTHPTPMSTTDDMRLPYGYPSPRVMASFV